MKAVVFDGLVLGFQLGLLGVGLSIVYGLGGVMVRHAGGNQVHLEGANFETSDQGG